MKNDLSSNNSMISSSQEDSDFSNYVPNFGSQIKSIVQRKRNSQMHRKEQPTQLGRLVDMLQGNDEEFKNLNEDIENLN